MLDAFLKHLRTAWTRAHHQKAAKDTTDSEPIRKGGSLYDAFPSGAERFADDGRKLSWKGMLLQFPQDIHYGWRVLKKSPGFSWVAIATLAIGIGANTVAFGVLNSLILRELPLPKASQLVSVQPSDRMAMSFPNYLEIRNHADQFSGVAAYRMAPLGLDTGRSSQRIWGYLSTGNYFEVLRARPALGRFFGPAEDLKPNANPYAVLSYECWQRRFSGDPDIVGKTIRINGLPYSITGVAGENFRGTELFYRPEVWVPMSMQAQIEGFPWLDDRATFNTMVIGRLKEGVSRETAQAQLGVIADSLARQYPRWNWDLRFTLWRPGLAGGTARGPVAGFTTGIVFLASLILAGMCANLAMLLTARMVNRQRELAIRVSLGGSHRRVAQQLVTESLLLSCAGGLAGWCIASVLLRFLSYWRAPLEFPVQLDVTPDWRVLLFAWIVSIVSGLLFGVAPARILWRTDIRQALTEASVGVPRKWPLRDMLVTAQVAICCVLVVSSLLAMRGLQHALSISIGFKPAGVAVAAFDLGLLGLERSRGQAIQRSLLEGLGGMPGVSVAAFASSVPLSIDQSFTQVASAEESTGRPGAGTQAVEYQVSPGYFQTMHTRLLSGREFGWEDSKGQSPRTILNATLARRLFGHASVVGRRVRIGTTMLEVIGVAEDGKYVSLTEESRPALFRSALQSYNGTTVLIARTSMSEAQVALQLRKHIADRQPSLAVYGVGSLRQMLGFAFFPTRAATLVLTVFGVLAAMLAIAGIHGVAACAVNSRRREIAIRMAVGARSHQILRSVLGRTNALVLLGSACGCALSLAAEPLLGRVVYGVSLRDPLVLVCVPIAMALIGLGSSASPAVRAVRTSPSEALRL